jgi:hypothetical protein
MDWNCNFPNGSRQTAQSGTQTASLFFLFFKCLVKGLWMHADVQLALWSWALLQRPPVVKHFIEFQIHHRIHKSSLPVPILSPHQESPSLQDPT